MKINEPVTQNEISFPAGSVLVSKTDTRGMITYCNRAFIDISGFNENELLGKSHNIVRHPDMPAAAFQDLWDTVAAGKPWTGIVKNRTKNGDHYWVKANVSPIYQGGRVTEYISVRTEPAREEIAAAEALYRDINAERASLKPGIRQRVAGLLQRFGVKTLLAASVIAMLAVLLLIAMMIHWRVAPPVIYTVLAVTGLVTAIFGFTLTAYVTAPLKYATEKLNQVSQGNYFDWIESQRDDDIGRLLQMIKMTQIKLGFDVMDAREQAATSKRIKTAVDSVSTNVMLADQNYNIIYINPALQRMMKQAEADIREVIPGFNADKLLGSNIDVFHKKPSHQRAMLDGMQDTLTAELEVGSRHFRIIANVVLDDQQKRIGTAVEWLDRTSELALRAAEQQQLEQERIFARENQRIRTALDNVSSSVMLADNERRIIYMNKTAQILFREAEQDIRRDLPNFDAANLINTQVDTFHKNPQHQMRLIDNLKDAHVAELKIGGRTMNFIANPVLTDEGERLGTAVEWKDRTDEVAIENEVENIVAAARNGELYERIDLTGKQGFFRHLSVGINSLLESIADVFDDIAEAMARLESGDLSQTITRVYRGRFGEVKQSVNGTIKQLESVVRQLREMSEQISSASDEISAGNANLSSRTEQQAANLEETAASMEELTSTVRNNADNAQQANQVAGTARNSAEKGGEVVSSAVAAMDEINASSNRIAEIIGVIDEIAFQTNLLALNASVEAARAGEQGRGFAVVATEVRNLASRSADAAKEIKALIQDSQTKVAAGAELVNASGKTLEDIVHDVKKVGDIVAEIAASSAEQASGIDQVNQAITSIDEITQQNAALAEQTSAASASLYDKAAEMNNTMGRFQVRSDPDQAWEDEIEKSRHERSDGDPQ